MTPRILTQTADGFTLRVRLTPGASADRVEGPGADAAGTPYLAVRVRARPDKGQANAALETTLAKALGAPKSAVSVERGTTARVKMVRITAGGEALIKARRLTGETEGEDA